MGLIKIYLYKVKELIRSVLQEQISDNELDTISHELNNLIPKKIKRYPLSFFMVDENNAINLELDKNGFLWVNNKILNHLSDKLLLSHENLKKVLKSWITKKYK